METRFDTRREYREAFLRVLGAARREVRIFDPDLAALNADSLDALTLIQHLLLSDLHHRLILIVHDTAPLLGKMPRLRELAQRFSHNFRLFQTPPHLLRVQDCFCVADTDHALVRFHRDHMRGKLIFGNAQAVTPYRRRFDTIWAECLPFAVSQTGLR